MKIVIALAGVLALSGCASDGAFAYDANDDLHCSVLSFYMHGRAKHIDAPIAEQRALYVLKIWYAARVQDAGGPTLEKARPVLEAVKRDPDAASDAVFACSDRAQAASGFAEFYKVAAARYQPAP